MYIFPYYLLTPLYKVSCCLLFGFLLTQTLISVITWVIFNNLCHNPGVYLEFLTVMKLYLSIVLWTTKKQSYKELIILSSHFNEQSNRWCLHEFEIWHANLGKCNCCRASLRCSISLQWYPLPMFLHQFQ